MSPIEGAPTSITAFIGRASRGPVNIATPIPGWAEFGDAFGGLWAPGAMTYAVRQFFDNGGREAVIVRVSAGIAAPEAMPGTPDGGAVTEAEILGDRATHTGLFALDAVEPWNLLCLPPLDEASDLSPATWAAAAAYCLERRAMLLVDAPAEWSALPDVSAVAAKMRELVAEIGTRAAGHAAVYFPRLQVADPLAGNSLRNFAPCGAVAGMFARIDAARGVWKSPAGASARLVGVVRPTRDLSDVELARLNTVGLNGVRTLPRAGAVVWGARTAASTLAGESEWKYIPVRRLTLFIEQSIERGLQWVLFEPNGEELWARVRGDIANFLAGLFRDGVFPATKPDDAYFVKCDASTMTPDDIAGGRLVVEVGIAPERPAEFVIFSIAQALHESRSRF